MASPGFYSSMTCCFMGHQDIPRWEEQKILTWIGSLEFPTFNFQFIGLLLNRKPGSYGQEGKRMKIEHIALYVNDLEAARDFFVKYLGGKSNSGYHNPGTGFRSCFISFEDGARLEIMTKPGLADQEKPLNRTGYAHIAFSVGGKEKVDALTEQLCAAGYEVVSGPRTTGDGYYESCIVAVEGNQIEITE